MIFEPPETPPNGALDVSPVTTRMLSSSSPNVSAAIAMNAFSMPLMSAAAVTTVSLPSPSSLQIAAAGSRPPGQKPSATPMPSPSGSASRRCQSGCAWTRSRHSRAPKDLIGCPSRPESPAASTLRSRSSIGSSSSSAASRSISDSTAKAAGGAPGAR